MADRGTAESYRVFVRNWWRWERVPRAGHDHAGRPCVVAAPRKLVPDPGARKTTLATRCTYEEARRICEEYARTHKPGPLSRKAEFEREN